MATAPERQSDSTIKPLAFHESSYVHCTDLIHPIFRLPRLRALFLTGLALAALLLGPCAAFAGELELDSLILDNHQGNIGVRFGVRLVGLDELLEELNAGTTVALDCEASVSRKGRVWLDKELTGIQWRSTLSKDVLADEFLLQLPGEDKPRRGKNLRELIKAGWGGLTLDLGPWDALTPGHDYQLGLNISLDRTDVPIWLRYVVFFWSFDVYPPASYQLDFSY